MKLLTTAAMALALTGAAAAAHAQQPQNNQHPTQHQGSQKGGQPQGGQPHYRAPTGGQRGPAGPQGGQHFNGQPNGQVQQFNGRPGGPGAGGQANRQVQQWNGQRGGPGAGAQRGGPGFNGQPGARYNGQAGGRAGFGFQSHGLRGRDQGRVAFSAGAFAPQYRAQRQFQFSGYAAWPSGWYFRNWSYGQFLPFGWFAPQYYISWGDYGLPPPPIGCEWIAQGPDAVLVDIWTGEVLSVYQGVFYWNG